VVKSVDPKSGSPSSSNDPRGKRARRPVVSLASGDKKQGLKRDRKWGKWIVWGITFSSVITLSAALGASLALISPFFKVGATGEGENFSITDIFEGGFQYGIARPVNVLVMGIDRNLDIDPETGKPSTDIFKTRSDTMLLVRLDPATHKVVVLSIPRDTRVEIPDEGLTKINHANWIGGPELASEVVSKTLNDVRIDRYARISTGAFRELIDAVGGVEVFVPIRMLYEDKTQGLSIDLEPGLQTLDGTQAEGFSRFRNDEAGDIGRTQRQQVLMKALQKRLSNPLMIAKIPQIFGVLQKYIDSDLSLGEMLALVQFGLQIKSDQLQMTLLPGRFSTPEEFDASYWVMDFSAMDRVMQSYFDVAPPVGYETALEDNPDQDYLLRIDIQNTTEDINASFYMADYLQSLGYGNVHVDMEWPQEISKTQIIPQWGNVEAGKRLQALLAKSDVTVDSTGALQSELTIRLGTDWLKTRQAKEFSQSYQDQDPPVDSLNDSSYFGADENWSNQNDKAEEEWRESFE
jgi:polyisoprenyl-teichoic acid--peptidoglycan teichoic acid transferase